jgi:hypothetical protein
MEAISPEQVFAAVEKLVDSGPLHGGGVLF